jgi:hypothetical protein
MRSWESGIGSRSVVDQESEHNRRALERTATRYHAVNGGLHGAAVMSLPWCERRP